MNINIQKFGNICRGGGEFSPESKIISRDYPFAIASSGSQIRDSGIARGGNCRRGWGDVFFPRFLPLHDFLLRRRDKGNSAGNVGEKSDVLGENLKWSDRCVDAYEIWREKEKEGGTEGDAEMKNPIEWQELSHNWISVCKKTKKLVNIQINELTE